MVAHNSTLWLAELTGEIIALILSCLNGLLLLAIVILSCFGVWRWWTDGAWPYDAAGSYLNAAGIDPTGSGGLVSALLGWNLVICLSGLYLALSVSSGLTKGLVHLVRFAFAPPKDRNLRSLLGEATDLN